MSFCPECGSKVDKKDTFCPECGKSQKLEAPTPVHRPPKNDIKPKVVAQKEIPKEVKSEPTLPKKEPKKTPPPTPSPKKTPPKTTPPDAIPPKGGFNWINVALACLLVLSLITFGYTYDSSQTQITRLKNQLNDAQDEADELRRELKNIEYQLGDTESQLSSTKQTLDTTKSQLESTASELRKTESELKETKSELTTTQATLGVTKETLSSTEQQLTLKETLNIGHTIQDHYQKIRDNEHPQDIVGILLWTKEVKTSSFEKKVEFEAELARHDLGRVYLGNGRACDDYYKLTEKRCYNEAKSKLNSVLNFAGVYTSDSDTVKIKKILTWLTDNIHYEPDIDDTFRAPIETLSLESGDCDDYTILAGALFENAGIESAVGSFIADDEYYGHAMVLVRLDGLSGYSSRGYDDLTDYGLSVGRWTKIEPQNTIDNQNNAYIKKWKLRAVSEI